MVTTEGVGGSIRNAVIVATISFAVFVAVGVRTGPPPIVGDELDYYSTLYGWGTYGSPTLSQPVVKAVREGFPGRPAYEPHTIRAVDGTYDAQHFWFMSLLDSPFFRLCKATGSDWRYSFTFLNALVFALAIGVTYWFFQFLGAAILVAGTLSSPLLAYTNRAHAEHYTVCLLTVAVLFVQGGWMLAAALALSAISAQVSAFSPLAAAVLLFYILRKGVRRIPRIDWLTIAACVFLLAVQPVWSLWRHHKINVLIGVGDVWLDMATPKRISELLIDPDIGLFFNWPLCLVIALLSINGIRRNFSLLSKYKTFWAFVFPATLFLAFIAAQQLNYTTAATRYSLWFLPFSLVGFMLVFMPAFGRPGLRTFAVANIAVFFVAAALNGYYLIGVRGVSPSLVRSPLSEAWYRLLPGVYDPEEQTFADIALHGQMVSGRALYLTGRLPVDGLPDRYIWAMSNRACTKILALAYTFNSSTVQPRLPLGCEAPVDGMQLLQYIRQSSGPPMRDRFVTVPSSELRRMRPLRSTASELPAFVNHPPRVAAIDATQVRGNEVVYTFQFADQNGWQDLKTAYLMVRGRDDAEAAPHGPSCVVKYSSPNHFLATKLANGKMSSYVVPGQSKNLAPGQSPILHGQACTIDVTRGSVSAQGDTLTLSLDVRLDLALLRGPSVVAASIEDLDGANSGWTTNGQPAFDFKQEQPDRPRDELLADVSYKQSKRVNIVWLLVNNNLETKNACYITYDRASNQLLLTPDSGDTGKAGKISLTGAGHLENSQCALYANGSTVVAETNRVRLRLHATRKGAFQESKRIWAAVQYEDGTTSLWQETGFWR